MSYVISHSQSGQRNLTHPADGPVTVLGGVTIGGFGTYGIAAYGGTWSLRNFGTVTGQTAGIVLMQGGTVANGAVSHPDAYVAGGKYGVLVRGAAGSVFNAGTIGSLYTYSGSPPGSGVVLAAGGTVTNGSLQLLDATIGSRFSGENYGVKIGGGFGAVTNFGTIYGYHVAAGLADGGTVSNGSIDDGTATVRGGLAGVSISGGTGVVTNLGTIVAYYLGYATSAYFTQGVAVSLAAGGSVRNGSPHDAKALLAAGYTAVQIDGAAGTVANYGTILSKGYESDPNTTTFLGYALSLTQGGMIINAASGLISSYHTGVVIKGADGTVINAGTILETRGHYGIDMLTNQATVFNTGVITGVEFGTYGGNEVRAATLFNAGTIEGAVAFGTAQARLVVAPGAAFAEPVTASGAIADVIELAHGAHAGTLSGLGSQYTGFGKIDLDRGAHWMLGGTNLASTLVIRTQPQSELSVGGTLQVDHSLALRGSGSLDLDSAGAVVVGPGAGASGAAGAVRVEAASSAAASGTIAGAGVIGAPIVDDGLVEAKAGTLAVQGALSGSGTAEIGAHAVLWAKQTLDVARVAFLGSGYATLELSDARAATSVISGFGPSDRIDLLGRVATGLSYSNATHVLTVDGSAGVLATLHFAGGHPADAFTLAADGHGGSCIMLR